MFKFCNTVYNKNVYIFKMITKRYLLIINIYKKINYYNTV